MPKREPTRRLRRGPPKGLKRDPATGLYDPIPKHLEVKEVTEEMAAARRLREKLRYSSKIDLNDFPMRKKLQIFPSTYS